MNQSSLATIPIYDTEPYLKELETSIIAINENAICLSESIFYPTGGGQPGDTGQIILNDDARYSVVDTFRDSIEPSKIWLRLDTTDTLDTLLGQSVKVILNWDERFSYMQMHTALHLLCSIVDAPVTGCSISKDKARLDFDLPESTVDRKSITSQINSLIEKAIPVKSYSAPKSEIIDLIRTSTVSPPAYDGLVRLIEIEGTDIQPCGGTHVRNTNEISELICSKIKKVSKHNRRIELSWA